MRWPELTVANQPAGLYRRGDAPFLSIRRSATSRRRCSAPTWTPAELSLNISTGSQVSLLTETPLPGNYQTRPYFAGRFLNTITHLPAGRSLNALVELLGELALAEGHVLRDPWSTISECRRANRSI